MGPPSYLRSVVGRNVAMRRMTVQRLIETVAQSSVNSHLSIYNAPGANFGLDMVISQKVSIEVVQK
jgi:hypothetical protein